MSKYKDPDKLIEELLFVLNYAESDLSVLAKGDNSDRTRETLREIIRVKELVAYNKTKATVTPLDLFNRRL